MWWIAVKRCQSNCLLYIRIITLPVTRSNFFWSSVIHTSTSKTLSQSCKRGFKRRKRRRRKLKKRRNIKWRLKGRGNPLTWQKNLSNQHEHMTKPDLTRSTSASASNSCRSLTQIPRCIHLPQAEPDDGLHQSELTWYDIMPCSPNQGSCVWLLTCLTTQTALLLSWWPMCWKWQLFSTSLLTRIAPGSFCVSSQGASPTSAPRVLVGSNTMVHSIVYTYMMTYCSSLLPQLSPF